LPGLAFCYPSPAGEICIGTSQFTISHLHTLCGCAGCWHCCTDSKSTHLRMHDTLLPSPSRALSMWARLPVGEEAHSAGLCKQRRGLSILFELCPSAGGGLWSRRPTRQACANSVGVCPSYSRSVRLQAAAGRSRLRGWHAALPRHRGAAARLRSAVAPRWLPRHRGAHGGPDEVRGAAARTDGQTDRWTDRQTDKEGVMHLRKWVSNPLGFRI
jgi:hypothetical protein